MNYAIGIDLGGTSIKYALVDSSGNILCHDTVPAKAQESSSAVISQIVIAINHAQDFARREGVVVSGVGIGTPGVIDRERRMVIGGADNIVGWSMLPLAESIEKCTRLDTTIGNDACVMALAELHFGAAKGCEDAIFVTIGTGIGGALLLGGKMRSTEFGHAPFIANGIPCNCGSLGCFEAYASTRAMVDRYSDKLRCAGLPCTEIDGKVITQRYLDGDSMATDAIEQECYYVGRGIAGFINTFAPQRVVVGGGISEAGDFFISKIRGYALRNALKECSSGVEIVGATLGNRAGVVGAAQLVFDKASQ